MSTGVRFDQYWASESFPYRVDVPCRNAKVARDLAMRLAGEECVKTDARRGLLFFEPPLTWCWMRGPDDLMLWVLDLDVAVAISLAFDGVIFELKAEDKP